MNIIEAFEDMCKFITILMLWVVSIGSVNEIWLTFADLGIGFNYF